MKISDTELFEFIDVQKETHPVKTLCDVLGGARSSFYQSHHKVESNRSQENKELLHQIEQIHKESKGRYGAPKIHKILIVQGF